MALKKTSIAAVAASGLGAVAALGAANEADALNYLRTGGSSTDFLSNFATKPTSTSAGFSINGVNSVGTSWGYGYRSGNTIYAQMYTQGGSMYARSYARCYSSSQLVYSAVYSNWTNNSTYQSISCSALPSGAGPWSMVGWGVAMLSWADSSIPGSNRNMCDGQGCGAPDTIKIGSSFLNQYTALNTSHEGIGGTSSVSVPGPSSVYTVQCW